MPSTEKRTFSLSAEQAGCIDARVASGAYATASEAVRAGLRALQERDAVVERWLREEVVPAYDARRSASSPSVGSGRVAGVLLMRGILARRGRPRLHGHARPPRAWPAASAIRPEQPVQGGGPAGVAPFAFALPTRDVPLFDAVQVGIDQDADDGPFRLVGRREAALLGRRDGPDG